MTPLLVNNTMAMLWIRALFLCDFPHVLLDCDVVDTQGIPSYILNIVGASSKLSWVV